MIFPQGLDGGRILCQPRLVPLAAEGEQEVRFPIILEQPAAAAVEDGDKAVGIHRDIGELSSDAPVPEDLFRQDVVPESVELFDLGGLHVVALADGVDKVTVPHAEADEFGRKRCASYWRPVPRSGCFSRTD